MSARSWLKPGGSRGMGLLLKSAICSARSFLISSGISGMSGTKLLCIKNVTTNQVLQLFNTFKAGIETMSNPLTIKRKYGY